MYRALERCFVDGALRNAGEVFEARRFEPCPPHLRELSGNAFRKESPPEPAQKNGPNAGKSKAFAGATAADMGVHPPDAGADASLGAGTGTVNGKQN
jgi:hypothetical protein